MIDRTDSQHQHEAPRSIGVPKDWERRVLSVSEASRYCSVPSEEVLTWIDTGMLRATRVGLGVYRIGVSDLMAFLQSYGFRL